MLAAMPHHWGLLADCGVRRNTAEAISFVQVTISALNAANTAVLAMSGPPSQAVAPPAGMARPQSTQPFPSGYRPNWLQLQAAAHAPKPGQSAEPLRSEPPALPQQSSWIEVKSVGIEKAPDKGQPAQGKRTFHWKKNDTGMLAC